MDFSFDPQLNSMKKVQESKTGTYSQFRDMFPKPSGEDRNLRHILRFYIARSMLKRGEKEIYVLPEIKLGEKIVVVDVLAGIPGKYSIAITEPESITKETEDILELAKDQTGLEVIVVHSQYGNPGSVMTRFQKQLENKQFRILAVVPPPFDDVYEYDIWMFETTFNDLLSR